MRDNSESALSIPRIARMTSVVEQATSQDKEASRESRPILMQQDGQGISLSHAAK